MIIGTVRPEEAKVFDSEAGFHRFLADDGSEYGSFEVYWHTEDKDAHDDDDAELCELASGWYWRSCFPGCLPDGEPNGPYARSRLAYEDARPEPPIKVRTHTLVLTLQINEQQDPLGWNWHELLDLQPHEFAKATKHEATTDPYKVNDEGEPV